MIPKLTDDQRRENAAKATLARQERAKIRAALKDGAMSMAQALELADSGNQAVRRMPVHQLVSAMPTYGFARTRDLMHDLGIARCKRVKGLGARQRAALLDVFGGAR